MPSSSLLLGVGAILSTLSAPVIATTYQISETYTGANWLDAFNFVTEDPNHGFVNYVNENIAKSSGLYKTEGDDVLFGVDASELLDYTNGPGRKSVRLEGKKNYNHGVFVLDIKTMPGTCGMWPAFWSLGQEPWPVKGEIDIIEGVNKNTVNKYVLHTDTECKVDGLGQSNPQLGKDCALDTAGTAGCDVNDVRSSSFGPGLNAVGGGYYIMEWDSDAIKTWFFPRGQQPRGLLAPEFDTASLGTPAANFQGDCNIDERFKDQRFIFNTNFCGDWAGAVYAQSGCPMYRDANGNDLDSQASCRKHVATHPEAFLNQFWRISSFRTFTKKSVISSSSSSAMSSTSSTKVSSSSSMISSSSSAMSSTSTKVSSSSGVMSSLSSTMSTTSTKVSSSSSMMSSFSSAMSSTSKATSSASSTPASSSSSSAMISPSSSSKASMSSSIPTSSSKPTSNSMPASSSSAIQSSSSSTSSSRAMQSSTISTSGSSTSATLSSSTSLSSSASSSIYYASGTSSSMVYSSSSSAQYSASSASIYYVTGASSSVAYPSNSVKVYDYDNLSSSVAYNMPSYGSHSSYSTSCTTSTAKSSSSTPGYPVYGNAYSTPSSYSTPCPTSTATSSSSTPVYPPTTSAPVYGYSLPASSKTTITTTYTSTYVDVCETGYTTIKTTYTVEYCPTTTPAAQPTPSKPNNPPIGWQVTTKICTACQGPKTVTVTVPCSNCGQNTPSTTLPSYGTLTTTTTSQVYQTTIITLSRSSSVPVYNIPSSMLVPSAPASSKPNVPATSYPVSSKPSVPTTYAPVMSKPATSSPVVYGGGNMTMSYGTGVKTTSVPSKTGYAPPLFTGAASGLQAGAMAAVMGAVVALVL